MTPVQLHISDVPSLEHGEKLKSATLFERIKADVAAQMDRVRDRYIADCKDCPPCDAVLGAIGRLKDSPRMDNAWKEFTKRNKQGELLYPVSQKTFFDDFWREKRMAELDRVDRDARRHGQAPMDQEERARLIDSFPLVGGSEERLIRAAATLALCAVQIMLKPPPTIVFTVGKNPVDTLGDMQAKAVALLKASRMIKTFLRRDKTAIYDDSVFETLTKTIIPALEQNVRAKNHQIFLELQEKNTDKARGQRALIVVLHARMEWLFGEGNHLYRTVANIAAAALDLEINDDEVKATVKSAARNATRPHPETKQLG